MGGKANKLSVNWLHLAEGQEIARRRVSRVYFLRAASHMTVLNSTHPRLAALTSLIAITILERELVTDRVALLKTSLIARPSLPAQWHPTATLVRPIVGLSVGQAAPE